MGICRVLHYRVTVSSLVMSKYGLPWWLSSKESTCNVGVAGSVPGLGRSPGEGNGNLLQYSCLENPMSRGAWWATVHGVTKESDTIQQLNNNKRFPKWCCPHYPTFYSRKIRKMWALRPQGWAQFIIQEPVKLQNLAECGFTVTSRRKCLVACHRTLSSTRDY